MARFNLRAWFGGHQPPPPAPTFQDRLPGQKNKNLKRVKWKRPRPNEERNLQAIWKLAYADFMTALMAFFLTMWLVSAFKNKPLGVASLFNPIRLTDPTPYSPGLRDAVRHRAGNEWTAALVPGPAHAPAKPPGEDTGDPQGEAVFRSPFPVLAGLATQAERAIKAGGHPNALAGDGASHETFLDDYILAPARQWIAAAMGAGSNGTPETGATEDETLTASSARDTAAQASMWRETGSANAKPGMALGEKQKLAENEQKATQLDKELSILAASLPEHFRPEIEVKAISEGVLICLTDGTRFNMFRTGSAAPTPELVHFLEKLGNLLLKYPGGIVIRGHTDARPFAGDPHGNWRLSADRAMVTFYMLIRGKVPGKRFAALQGFGDREPKNKTDPFAAENRRIEILIRPQGNS